MGSSSRRRFLRGSLVIGGGSISARLLPSSAVSVSAQDLGEERIIALDADIASLDPYLDASVSSLLIQVHLFDPLVDFRGPDLVQTPMLAESWEIVDDTTWRFVLRKGVNFHDGSPLTAEDVKFSIEYGQTDTSVHRAKLQNITEVVVVDPTTVEFKTAALAASLLANLSYIYILPRAAVEAQGIEAFGKSPIGSGPYQFSAWDEGQRVAITANELYWGGIAQPPALTFRPITESATRLAELQTGGVQIIKSIPAESVSMVEGDDALAVLLNKGPRQIFFPINSQAGGPLADARVRQAVNFGIDRQTLVDFILEGFGEVRTGPFAPSQLGFNEEASQFYSYDPERARQLLEDAGYGDGIDVTWNISRGAFVKDSEMIEAIANQLGDIGVNVNINLIELTQLFSEQEEGNFEIGLIRWSRQIDTDTVVAGLRVESAQNPWYANEDVDRLAASGRSTLDTAEREQIYRELYQVMVEDPPFVYIHAQDEAWGKQTSSAWELHPFAGNAGVTLFSDPS